MPTSVDIVLQQQMVLVVVDLGCRCEIARLKATLKHDGIIVLTFPCVERLYINLEQGFLLWIIFLSILLILGNLSTFQQLFNV